MTNARTFRITTLGCRVNHAETRELDSILRCRGLSPAATGQPADLEVVHTCSVTNQAAAKSRQAVRRARRRQQGDSPTTSHTIGDTGNRQEPEILVTGCYATTNSEEAAEAAGRVDRVLTHAADDHSSLLDRFARRIDQWLDGEHQHHSIIRSRGEFSSDSTASPPILSLPVVEPASPPANGRPAQAVHTRAELKIQDGCDACCTFCILPKIRPTLRSKTIDDAVTEAHQLVDRGHLEIVLTGIFIGAYGHETALRRRQQNRYASPLADLLDAVAQVPGLQRLRISSMEPGDVDEPLIDAMLANTPTVVPHLHLPLQSGSDAILKKMNRQYRVGDYLEMIDQVSTHLSTPDGLPPAITTDIICGFPGETEDDFQQTIDVARRVGYLHMHVFPYSPKRGTAAARWTDRFVSPDVARQRVRHLINLETDPDDGLSIRYRRRLIGRRARVILEQPTRDAGGNVIPGTMSGRCDHYARIDVPTDQPRGTLLDVDIIDADAERTYGQPLPKRMALPLI